MNELSLQDKEANIDKLHDIVEENDDDGENNGSYLRQEDSGKADVNGRRRTSNSSDEKVFDFSASIYFFYRLLYVKQIVCVCVCV